MKKYRTLLHFLIIIACCHLPFGSLCAAPSVNSDDFFVFLSDFSLGNIDIKGNVHINISEQNEYLVYALTAENVRLGDLPLNSVEAKVTKKNNEYIITYIKGDIFLATGKIDFSRNFLSLNINVNFPLFLKQVKGEMRGKLSVEGDINKPWIKGTLYVKDGTYGGQNFSRATFSCSGYPPYLRLSDAEIILYDGSRYSMEGFINLNDFQTLFSSSTLSSQEVNLGEWKVFSGDSGAGFAKDIDSHMGVAFGSSLKNGDETENLGAEFRYQLAEDKFLKLRMEEDRSIVGFEKRHEF